MQKGDNTGMESDILEKILTFLTGVPPPIHGSSVKENVERGKTQSEGSKE